MAPTDPRNPTPATITDPMHVRRYIPLHPAAVEAVQWDGLALTAQQIMDWLDSHGVPNTVTMNDDDGKRMEFRDPETSRTRYVMPSMWIIRDGNRFETTTDGCFRVGYKQADRSHYTAHELEQIEDGQFALDTEEETR